MSEETFMGAPGNKIGWSTRIDYDNGVVSILN